MGDRRVGIRPETARVVRVRLTTDESLTAAWVAQGLQPLVFGVAATALTATGHVLAGGGLPSALVLGALLVASTAWRAAVSVGPRSLPATTVSMLVAQGLGHLALGMSHPGALSGVGHHDDAGALAAALVGAPEPTASLGGQAAGIGPASWLAQAPDPAMIGLHLAAGMLLAVWLHRGEARTFALIARLRARFTRRVPRVCAPIRPVRAPSSAVAGIAPARAVLVVDDAPRRGPPRPMSGVVQVPLSHGVLSQSTLRTVPCLRDMSSCHTAPVAVTQLSRSARVALARSCHRTPSPDRVKLGVCCHGVPSCCSCVCTGRHTYARRDWPDRPTERDLGRRHTNDVRRGAQWVRI